MMHLDSIGKQVTGAPFSWNVNDTLLYAVSVGGGSKDPSQELSFTTENTATVPHQVLPTFATILTMKANCSALSLSGDFKLSAMIHAGQEVRLTKPIAAAGEAVGTNEITNIYDLGKHAMVETTTTLKDTTTGDEIAKTVSRVIVLGEGGFGGSRPPKPAPVAELAATSEVAGTATAQTQANQALIYRLNGDHNPLHSDPEMAAKVGFKQPILHGLCTYGFVARELINHVLQGDTSRFTAIDANFIAPVMPGQEIIINWWVKDAEVLFNATSNDQLVLDGGRLEHA